MQSSKASPLPNITINPLDASMWCIVPGFGFRIQVKGGLVYDGDTFRFRHCGTMSVVVKLSSYGMITEYYGIRYQNAVLQSVRQFNGCVRKVDQPETSPSTLQAHETRDQKKP